MTEEIKVKKEVFCPNEIPERKLPMLKKGMKIKYDGSGIAEVLADEAIGSCIVRFADTQSKSKGGTGVRDIHMGIGHKMIEIIEDSEN